MTTDLFAERVELAVAALLTLQQIRRTGPGRAGLGRVPSRGERDAPMPPGIRAVAGPASPAAEAADFSGDADSRSVASSGRHGTVTVRLVHRSTIHLMCALCLCPALLPELYSIYGTNSRTFQAAIDRFT